MQIVYVAFNTESINRAYIGKTKHSLEVRKLQHEKQANKNAKSPFHKALKSYGFDCFVWYELMEVPDNEVNDLEKFYIAEFRSDGYNLYNITAGGDGGDVITNNPNRDKIIEKLRGKRFSDEQKQKLREIAMARGFGKWMTGKKLSDSHRESISSGIKSAMLDPVKAMKISHKGSKKIKPFSAEHRRKLGDLHRGRPKSDEHKRKISETLRRKKNN